MGRILLLQELDSKGKAVEDEVQRLANVVLPSPA
jgi:hypothetical protein